jgi:glutaminyl-peptide cyclotransferase
MRKPQAAPKNTSSRRLSGQTWFLAASVLAAFLVAGYLVLIDRVSNGNSAERRSGAAGTVSQLQLQDIPFNGARAYDYLKKLCDIGPRPSGSPGMAAQQRLLEEHFKSLADSVEWQRFQVPHPSDGSAVSMANLIVRWGVKKKERILLCAHYDTLPFPLRDPRNPRGVFVGANDNASGVAVLMELANDIGSLRTKCGIDIVLLDAEEFMFTEHGRFFIGSEYFAREYAGKRPAYRYRWGILLDMVGGKNLQLYQEQNSLWWNDTRPLVQAVWALGQRLGVLEFVPQPKHQVEDDHVRLHALGGISCIDIIDFDYPPWHTQDDTPEHCSPLSLAKVGWVLREWLKTQ